MMSLLTTPSPYATSIENDESERDLILRKIHQKQAEMLALQEMKRQLYFEALQQALVKIHLKYQLIHRINQCRQDLLVLAIQRNLVHQEALQEASLQLKLQIAHESYQKSKTMAMDSSLSSQNAESIVSHSAELVDPVPVKDSSNDHSKWTELAGDVFHALMDHFASLPQLVLSSLSPDGHRHPQTPETVPFYAKLDKNVLHEEWTGGSTVSNIAASIRTKQPVFHPASTAARLTQMQMRGTLFHDTDSKPSLYNHRRISLSSLLRRLRNAMARVRSFR